MIDMPTMWRRLWRLRVSIFLAAVAGAIVGMIAYMLVTPLFEASTLLLAANPVGQNDQEQRRAGDKVAALAQISGTEDVLRRAAILSGLVSANAPMTPDPTIERLYVALSRRLAVTSDPKADLVTISFRHGDPAFAAKFTNAVAQALSEKQLEVLSRPGATEFFAKQKARFDDEVRRASDELAAFSARTSTYSITEQRRLLLERQKELLAAQAETTNSIAQKAGQKQAIVEQLKKLKPVTSSSFVTGLVESMSAKEPTAAPSGKESRDMTAPPLLMVKVYQESIVELFKVDAELAGLDQLQSKQLEQGREMERQLDDLARAEGAYKSLTSAIRLAEFNSETYGKRVAEENVANDIATSRMSNLRVVQQARIPMFPVFPSLTAFVGGGAMLGGLLFLLLACVIELVEQLFDRRLDRGYLNSSPWSAAE